MISQQGNKEKIEIFVTSSYSKKWAW
jgi:hypothetical protein